VVLRTWARMLDHVPESRLLVKYLGKFASPWLREQWRAAMASAGVDPPRVGVFDGTPALQGHWSMIGSVDLALDPFPYQGTHTTLESLLMGVPVLTLLGDTSARRASSALLLQLGLDDLVTQNEDEYVQRGVARAADSQRRLRLRADLRERFLQSEICDVPGFVAELEAVYRRLSCGPK
jgi:protein O-GlcNAc transferase